jgi:predicted dehydrogenase
MHDAHTTTTTRRSILQAMGAGALTLGLGCSRASQEESKDTPIAGFEKAKTSADASAGWAPFSDRKLRVGLVGYGVCKFAAAFGFQDHPNVEVVAVSDLIPERCDGLAKAARCATTYASLEELVKDNTIEAVFVATDAPSHAAHVIECFEHGKHVACAVPACWGSLEEGERLFEAVKAARGLKYMMFETSSFHADLHAMRTLYAAAALGTLAYAEGEYYHYKETPIDSFKGWRVGLPPQWYPTHSNAYYVGVTGGSFTHVSCLGVRSEKEHLQPQNNPYQNPFGTEVALLRTSEGGTARMTVSWDTAGVQGETGRVRGTRGSVYDGKYKGLARDLPDTRRPPIPPTMQLGGHGGSHGPLTEAFVRAVLEDRTPLIDVCQALNMTAAGIVAHQSALKDGELLKIPQYQW